VKAYPDNQDAMLMLCSMAFISDSWHTNV
jgi:hypothetical protein